MDCQAPKQQLPASTTTMKKISATLIGLTLLTAPVLFAGEVYRIISKDGEVTFTDSPPANAKSESVDMPKINIAAPPPATTKNSKDEAGADESAYTKASITQPSNNATIPPGQREVVVQIALEPPLQTGHLVQIYVDGRKQGSPSASSTFTLSSLDRGEHSVSAEIVGVDKQRKAKTQTITLHVKQHSSND